MQVFDDSLVARLHYIYLQVLRFLVCRRGSWCIYCIVHCLMNPTIPNWQYIAKKKHITHFRNNYYIANYTISSIKNISIVSKMCDMFFMTMYCQFGIVGCLDREEAGALETAVGTVHHSPGLVSPPAQQAEQQWEWHRYVRRIIHSYKFFLTFLSVT